MKNSFRLGDKVQIGTSAECTLAMNKAAQALKSAAKWISENLERNDRSVVLMNLLKVSADYLEVAAANINGHVSVIALAARNLYEINLQTRDVLDSSFGLKRWQGEAVTDKVEMLEGIVSLKSATDTSEQRKIFKEEINRLLELRDKYSLPSAKPSRTAEIAKSAGISEEHKSLFKLYSKLVHPSSYLVNDHKNAASDEIYRILEIHIQLYAWDTFGRICDGVKMTESKRREFDGFGRS